MFVVFLNVSLKLLYLRRIANEIFAEILFLIFKKFIEIGFQVDQHIVFHIGKLKNREVVSMNFIACY